MQTATAGNLAHNPQNGGEPVAVASSVDSVHGLGRIENLMRELTEAGVVLSVEGGRLAFEAPADVLTDDLLGRMRADRDGLLALVDPAAAAVPDADAAVVATVEGYDERNPEDVPVCDACGRYCDAETLAGRWFCSRCTPDAEARRRRTRDLLLRADLIRYNSDATARVAPENRSPYRPAVGVFQSMGSTDGS